MNTAEYGNLPIFISLFAIITSLINLRSLFLPRLIIIFFALGSGQIYLSVFSYILFLFVESNFAFKFRILKKHAVFVYVITFLILFISLFSQIDSTTIIEFFQLGTYILIYLITLNFFNSENKLDIYLKAFLYSTTITAIISIIRTFLNLNTIFISTGNNEGSYFLLLLGFIPSYCLFISKKNPFFLITSFLNIYVMYISSARASILTSFIIIFISALYYYRNQIKILILPIFGIFLSFYYNQILNFGLGIIRNYSFVERVYLIVEGINFWQKSPIVGWGWGSSTRLASQIDIPMDPEVGIKVIHPHFHSTYVQLIVELGILGILFSILISYFFLNNAFSKDKFQDNLLISSFLRLSSLAIFISGFTEAYIYGAYRFLPVIFVLSIINFYSNKNFYIKSK